MNKDICINPAEELSYQPKNCLECEKLEQCNLVDFSKNENTLTNELKYKLLGKITYSNKPDYIGCFLEVSEYNYNEIKESMNEFLKDNNFEKHISDFTYHLLEIENVTPILDFDNKVLSRATTHLNFKVIVFYTMKDKFEFVLRYESKFPRSKPVNIFYKTILKED
jgi:hypothetical protein